LFLRGLRKDANLSDAAPGLAPARLLAETYSKERPRTRMITGEIKLKIDKIWDTMW